MGAGTVSPQLNLLRKLNSKKRDAGANVEWSTSLTTEERSPYERRIILLKCLSDYYKLN